MINWGAKHTGKIIKITHMSARNNPQVSSQPVHARENVYSTHSASVPFSLSYAVVLSISQF